MVATCVVPVGRRLLCFWLLIRHCTSLSCPCVPKSASCAEAARAAAQAADAVATAHQRVLSSQQAHVAATEGDQAALQALADARQAAAHLRDLGGHIKGAVLAAVHALEQRQAATVRTSASCHRQLPSQHCQPWLSNCRPSFPPA